MKDFAVMLTLQLYVEKSTAVLKSRFRGSVYSNVNSDLLFEFDRKHSIILTEHQDNLKASTHRKEKVRNSSRLMCSRESSAIYSKFQKGKSKISCRGFDHY